MNKNTICYYHNKDMDGYFSGAIVKKAIPNVELRGWDYKDEIPDIESLEGCRVILIDITFPFEDLLYLGIISDLTVIDHHISFYRETIDKALTFEYIYDDKFSACELGWNYFFDEHIPIAVKLTGSYDIWRNSNNPSWNNIVLPFKEYCYSIISSPEEVPEKMLESFFDIDPYIKEGKTILRAIKKSNKVIAKRAFEKEVYGGYKALCVNHFPFSNQILESIWDPEKYDLMVGFSYNGKGWGVSLRSEDPFDVSIIAKERGGGGHPQASGFQANTFEEIFK